MGEMLLYLLAGPQKPLADMWLDISIGQPLVDWFNKTAQPDDIARADHVSLINLMEEITAGQVRLAARLGATGPNQAKAYLRAGMGPCQGRMCGTTVAALIAAERGISIEDAGTLRPRAPFKPLTVGELAALPPEEVA